MWRTLIWPDCTTRGQPWWKAPRQLDSTGDPNYWGVGCTYTFGTIAGGYQETDEIITSKFEEPLVHSAEVVEVHDETIEQLLPDIRAYLPAF